MMSQGDMVWSSGLIPMIEPEIVTEIISRIGDLALVIAQDGRVLGVLLTDDLTVESVPKFEERLKEFIKSDGSVRPVELNHVETAADPEFPVRYSFHKIGTDGAILLLGHDLRPIAEMQQQLVAAQIALEKDYEAQREYDTRLRVLMAATEQATLFVSGATGEVMDCNPAAATLFGRSRTDLVGAGLPDLIEVEGQKDLLAYVIRSAGEPGTAAITSLTRKTQRTMTLSPTLFRSTGTQMLLCRLSQVDGGAARSDILRDQMVGLFENGSDGIVFVNNAGSILTANDAFLRLAEVTHTQAIKGRSVVDFLSRGNVDLNVIRENAARTGSMRLYATRLINEHGAEIAVEIATSHFSAGGVPVFAMVIRDASRSESMRSAGQQVTDVDMRSVIELIGNQTLKEIRAAAQRGRRIAATTRAIVAIAAPFLSQRS